MNILDKIILTKKQEVAQAKALTNILKLEQSTYFNRTTYSLKQFLLTKELGIIAEFKRKSPSKNIINDKVEVEEVTQGYAQSGAAAISILTDSFYFGGQNEDILKARPRVEVPILRKEFIIDEYQIIEAKAIGADIILLIAAVLTEEEILHFSKLAKSLGLSVLIEVHDTEELKKSLHDSIDAVGVNNRNLKTFEVSLETSKNLSALIPNSFLKISESGIYEVSDIIVLQKFGYQGFLIGENFMRNPTPHESLKTFIEQWKVQK
jgi:indole-3-glycerol phosphate synthase